MLQRVPFPLLQQTLSLPAFREGLLAISGILRLLHVSWGSSKLTRAVALPTLIDREDCGITSSVARAGALVSPALISPPSPLDLLRIRGWLSRLLGPLKGCSLSPLEVESRGKASVAGMM